MRTKTSFMKNLLIASSLFVIVISFGACTKSDQAKPATKTQVTSITDTTPVASIYPFTDTFTGVLTDTFIIDMSGSYGCRYNPYSVYATHLSADTVVYTGSASIQVQYYAVAFNLRDTLFSTSVVGSLYTGGFTSNMLFLYPGTDPQNVYVPNAIVFTQARQNLAFSWNVSFLPAISTCDYGSSSGQFNGILKSTPHE